MQDLAFARRAAVLGGAAASGAALCPLCNCGSTSALKPASFAQQGNTPQQPVSRRPKAVCSEGPACGRVRPGRDGAETPSGTGGSGSFGPTGGETQTPAICSRLNDLWARHQPLR